MNFFTRNILFLALPALLLFCFLLYTSDFSLKIKITLGLAALIPLGFFSLVIRNKYLGQLYSLANLLEGLRHGNYGHKLSYQDMPEAWRELGEELNQLCDLLSDIHFDKVETALIVNKLVSEIDIPLFVFDQLDELVVVNSAASQLYNKGKDAILGKTIAELNLETFFTLNDGQIIEQRFLQRHGKWEVRWRYFRKQGKSHRLLLINDLSRALREMEREAWQKMVRVLGHEINNSLATVKSMAQTLGSKVASSIDVAVEKKNFAQGLALIENRCEVLQRFIGSYSRLSKLPAPRVSAFSVRDVVERVVKLETRLETAIDANEDVILKGDSDQIQMLLVNLINNAIEAISIHKMAENGKISIGWNLQDEWLILRVCDNGPGIENMENIFTPFYTTKPDGSGIGLLLCRRIMEAHGGTLSLENNETGGGATALLWFPLNLH